jgi:hypothetical protein
MTRDQALALVRRIEGLAVTTRHDDPKAQIDVLRLVDLLREAPGPRSAIQDKIESIVTWTEILFSRSKREAYGGDEEVTALLLHDCERLRDVIRAD